MSATYYFDVPTAETYTYFQKGTWYKSNKQDIIALCTGNPESNDGYWGYTFAKKFFRLITPEEWQPLSVEDAMAEIRRRTSIFKRK